ncbi:MAG: MnhB domain-containing protein [Azospirillaceae bacterium]
MNSIILKAGARMLSALLIALSIYLLLRGHNEPGGGFVGGLAAAAAYALIALSAGWRSARRALPLDPRAIAMLGIGVAVVAGLLAALTGQPFLTGLWWKEAGLPLGTPLLFDVGVYLAVVGGVLTLLFAIEREA